MKTKPFKVLQLCCFTNFWSDDVVVESHDLRNGKNIFDLPVDYGKSFDFILSSPPCDQFTKASAHAWDDYPTRFIDIAEHCINISIESGKKWMLEQPPGRIERFFPILTGFRLVTVMFPDSNKEYILYGNTLLTVPVCQRYGFSSRKFNNMSKKQRERFHPDLIPMIETNVKPK
jgi:hypothetical protein